MRIFLYSDLHISRTSSILPISTNSKYTYRQDMIIKTGEWLAQIVSKEKPDMIINLGDTYDQHTVTSYDIDVASKFFSCFNIDNYVKNIPHYILVGNHEMINQNFNAVSILKNIPNVTVIDEPITINNLAFLPYCDYKEIFTFPEGTYLFSHQDIQGSSIRGDFVLPNGITQQQLKQYKLVFNGHIHKPSINGNVINVGSITTHSFSDDENSVPQCYIFDTNTMNLTTFKSNICPLFRKCIIEEDIQELISFVDNLDENYTYIIHCVCPFKLKEEVKQYLSSNSKILNSRLNVKMSKTDMVNTQLEKVDLHTNIDILQSFKEFLDTVDLKFPKELYFKVLE